MATAEQVQELITAVQELLAELQTVKAKNDVLKHMVMARDQSTDLLPMDLATGKYDGSPKKLKEFINTCIVYFTFRTTSYVTDQARVGFMVSNMVDNALAWVTPLVTSADPALQDFQAFLVLLRQTFERSKVVYSACESLLDLHQGSTDLYDLH
ncbi:protein LDOC1-like [Ambystoma mexicanum]|uniref:protein LDOC1-like n=1 Tax=Ambystoma mexicanum TaxID=8296 RepID=UPI0037E80117